MSTKNMTMHNVTSVVVATQQQKDVAVLKIFIRDEDGGCFSITGFSPYLPKGQTHEWFVAEKTENPSATLATYEYKTTPKNCDKCGQPVKGE